MSRRSSRADAENEGKAAPPALVHQSIERARPAPFKKSNPKGCATHALSNHEGSATRPALGATRKETAAPRDEGRLLWKVDPSAAVAWTFGFYFRFSTTGHAPLQRRRR